MKEIIEYIMMSLCISLALMSNVIVWVLIYDNIKERMKNRKHD